MSHELTVPVHRQGRQWTVTSYGIEPIDEMYHVPFADIPDADGDPPRSLDDLCRLYGADCDELAAALRMARAMHPEAGTAPSKSAA